MNGLPWILDDGGRELAGFRGATPGDCVVRAIAIAADLPYRDVYDRLHESALTDRRFMAGLELKYGAQARRHASPRSGVWPRHYRPLLAELGATWIATMGIGTGCTVHVRHGELPTEGRFVLSLSRHLSALVDGVIRDTHDPSRGGTRCVYGYWTMPS